MKDKKISVVHLYYLIILAVIIISNFLVIAFGGTKNASTVMGTAATVSSLILSVIAIVMTIVDVAGQRDTVSDIKDTAKKLQDNLETVNDGIQEISALKEELLNAMSLIHSSNATLVDEVAELKEKYKKEEGGSTTVDSEDFVKDLENLSERIQKVYEKPQFRNNYSISGHIHKITSRVDLENDRLVSYNIRSLIENSLSGVKKFRLTDVLWITEELNITRANLKNELNVLVKQNKLERDGEFYVFKNK
ncbi:hypothetical protein H9635_10130 [Solibacillus sp. A46]|uniref:Uncharacterized protein n=1 Tax=Solibacillus faecavium TaxID=2762221 RepID=A0ABR8XYW8_9BACL|nr:hypothetical protein [Solibacillus faecavium]MBD8037103.1 hypothetical protein [Solibacillus faecavium]